MDETTDLATQRVEHAKRRFEESWVDRWIDPTAVEQDLDELDIAVGLWLDARETDRERRVSRTASGKK